MTDQRDGARVGERVHIPRTNRDREVDGTSMVLTYIGRIGGYFPESAEEFAVSAQDLVSDILHAVASQGEDVERLLRLAEGNYVAERSGDA